MLALRGTTTVEDIITDSVAEPERLDPAWIAKGLRPDQDEAGALYAHAGIKAAADAVLKVVPQFCCAYTSSYYNPI